MEADSAPMYGLRTGRAPRARATRSLTRFESVRAVQKGDDTARYLILRGVKRVLERLHTRVPGSIPAA